MGEWASQLRACQEPGRWLRLRVSCGFEDVGFHEYMIVCLNCVPSVALNGAAFNPSWHLTAIGAGRSAVATPVASRRWVSFLR
jgi:hypothetical protein